MDRTGFWDVATWPDHRTREYEPSSGGVGCQWDVVEGRYPKEGIDITLVWMGLSGIAQKNQSIDAAIDDLSSQLKVAPEGARLDEVRAFECGMAGQHVARVMGSYKVAVFEDLRVSASQGQ